MTFFLLVHYILFNPIFFLLVHYFDPHVPYLSSGDQDPSRPPTRTAAARSLYADELRFLDAELARLFAVLDLEYVEPCKRNTEVVPVGGLPMRLQG